MDFLLGKCSKGGNHKTFRAVHRAGKKKYRVRQCRKCQAVFGNMGR